MHPANPPKSDAKYVEKVFNWSEVHLSKMTWDKFHTLMVMAIRVVEFSNGGKKLDRFLPKNQHIYSKEIIEF